MKGCREPAGDVLKPLRGYPGARLDGSADDLAHQVRPGPRDHVDQGVPASAESDEAAVGVLVREAVKGRVRRSLAEHPVTRGTTTVFKITATVLSAGAAVVFAGANLFSDSLLIHDRLARHRHAVPYSTAATPASLLSVTTRLRPFSAVR